MGEVVNIRDYKRKEEKKPLTDLEKLACELMDVMVKDTAKSHNEMILDRMKGVPANVASVDDPTIFGDPNVYAAPDKDPA